jgi:3-phenylpropionate/trans-cinnamate dioxygenase ferredoxin subunit
MSEWIDVIAANALTEGDHVVVDVDGVAVAVFKLDGQFYALEDVCTHDGAEIAGGTRDGEVIICPRHGARFCIKTGAVLSPPAYEDIPKMAVRVMNGQVQVKDERWD